MDNTQETIGLLSFIPTCCKYCHRQFNQNNRYPMLVCPKEFILCQDCINGFCRPEQGIDFFICPCCEKIIQRTQVIRFTMLWTLLKHSKKISQKAGKHTDYSRDEIIQRLQSELKLKDQIISDMFEQSVPKEKIPEIIIHTSQYEILKDEQFQNKEQTPQVEKLRTTIEQMRKNQRQLMMKIQILQEKVKMFMEGKENVYLDEYTKLKVQLTQSEQIKFYLTTQLEEDNIKFNDQESQIEKLRIEKKRLQKKNTNLIDQLEGLKLFNSQFNKEQKTEKKMKWYDFEKEFKNEPKMQKSQEIPLKVTMKKVQMSVKQQKHKQVEQAEDGNIQKK